MEEILDRLVPDMLAFRPERQALMRQLQEALAAERVDPERIEALRQQALELANRASVRATRAVLEAAQALDPTQRAKLIEHWRRRHAS